MHISHGLATVATLKSNVDKALATSLHQHGWAEYVLRGRTSLSYDANKKALRSHMATECLDFDRSRCELACAD